MDVRQSLLHNVPIFKVLGMRIATSPPSWAAPRNDIGIETLRTGRNLLSIQPWRREQAPALRKESNPDLSLYLNQIESRTADQVFPGVNLRIMSGEAEDEGLLCEHNTHIVA